MTIQWSQEQLDIFGAFQETDVNLIVNASPGSGKTTVSREIWQLAHGQKVLYLAFNKPIVTEMLAKIGLTDQELEKQGKAIRTFNSFGHRIVTSSMRVKLDQNKIYRYIKDIEYKFPENRRYEYKSYLAKAVQYSKSNIIPEFDRYEEGDIVELVDMYDLDTYPGMVRDVQNILKKSALDYSIIDFADQLLFPVIYELPASCYDLCIVDEAQDVNAMQRELLRKLAERNPAIRFVFVGDSRQAIYAFRGALADSMRVLGEEFHCVSYPLTITRRCPRSVVSKAQEVWREDINPAPGAQEGIVRDCLNRDSIDYKLKPAERNYTEVIPVEEWTEESMIICRTTAPIISFAYQLLRNKIPCHVRGREIGEQFIRYIEKSKCEYVVDFLEYMSNDIQQQIDQARTLNKEDKIQRLEDKRDTLEIFAEQCDSLYVGDMIQHIKNLFESGKGVTLSTIHKAKGLEAEKVYILAPDLMPHPIALKSGKDWVLEQEKNMKYVAITRSKFELVYI